MCICTNLKAENFKCWVQGWQHQMKVWIHMWKGVKFSYTSPIIGVQDGVEMDCQHANILILTFFLHNASHTCTFAKELTHPPITWHNKHDVRFVNKVEYFSLYNDTLTQSHINLANMLSLSSTHTFTSL